MRGRMGGGEESGLFVDEHFPKFTDLEPGRGSGDAEVTARGARDNRGRGRATGRGVVRE